MIKTLLLLFNKYFTHKKLYSIYLILLKDLNVRSETIQLLEENKAVPSDRHLSKECSFRYVSSGKGNKNKNKQMDDSKQKHFCTVKGTVNKTQSLPAEWVKMYLMKG